MAGGARRHERRTQASLNWPCTICQCSVCKHGNGAIRPALARHQVERGLVAHPRDVVGHAPRQLLLPGIGKGYATGRGTDEQHARVEICHAIAHGRAVRGNVGAVVNAVGRDEHVCALKPTAGKVRPRIAQPQRICVRQRQVHAACQQTAHEVDLERTHLLERSLVDVDVAIADSGLCQRGQHDHPQPQVGRLARRIFVQRSADERRQASGARVCHPVLQKRRHAAGDERGKHRFTRTQVAQRVHFRRGGFRRNCGAAQQRPGQEQQQCGGCGAASSGSACPSPRRAGHIAAATTAPAAAT